MNNKYALHHISKGKLQITNDAELKLAKPYFQQGDPAKPGILLIHGFTGTPHSLLNQAKNIANYKYTVSVPQLPGHGRLASDLIDISSTRWFEHVEQAYQKLNQLCPAGVICLGFSLGSALAIQLAAKYPTIKHLYLLCPAIYPPTLLKYGFPLAKPLKKCGLKFIWPIAGDSKDPSASVLAYRRTAIDGIIALMSAMTLAQESLTQIGLSTTIIAARHDALFTSNHINKIFQNLSSAEKEIIWLENSAHEATVDYDAAKIDQILLKKLNDIYSEIMLTQV